MKRNIIQIDQDKCIGCGLCANACMQGAIKIINGKAQLVSESYCDGLGMCLPQCPVDAIKLVEKESESFNHERSNIKLKTNNDSVQFSGCPSAQTKLIDHEEEEVAKHGNQPSRLRQWPIQLHLLNPEAPYFKDANLLLCADCVMASYGDFQEKLLKNRTIAIACPKLDNTQGYVEKLTQILKVNNIKTIVVGRMEVPCCGGITTILKQALDNSEKDIPVREVVISVDGKVK
ncbi:MAG: 4Fe-4S dicluster domain-containing protein [Firmicutes bacterium]|nr:4Fe-4S dicluster domain-containing protein [Bacillota bacterium]